MFRPLIAFLLAPFPAAFFQAIIVAIWPKEGMGVFQHPASMFAAICLLFYIFGFLLGLPLLLLSRRRFQSTLRGYAWGGAVAISLPIVIALAVVASRGQLSVYVALYNLIFFIIGGAVAGTLFRYIKDPLRVAQVK
ncbi:hypothetical protein [Sphingobium sp. 15-1]|uniref:hypothetical protein n=1 Tax=Sphingobium sp. 15-1 TaxID=2729616 RepID=UPI00159C3DF1|nr:hypothetical protein [Sphingobium sp. 15-1]